MSFSKDLKQFSLKALASSERESRELCFRTGNEIIEATPEDTGETRLNWQATIGQPATGIKHDLGSPESNTEAAFTALRAAVKNAPGNVFYLTNNTPQASVLEFGLYPNPPKMGTYLKAGQTKRGRSGPGYHKFSKNGFSELAQRGMVRVTVKQIAEQFK